MFSIYVVFLSVTVWSAIELDFLLDCESYQRLECCELLYSIAVELSVRI